ncbi:MAG: hypothetical protein QMC80_02415 [Thermoplasmatales archaeon]|nr:hypothetical protein [Thermoplasmatales archaeon]
MKVVKDQKLGIREKQVISSQELGFREKRQNSFPGLYLLTPNS